MDRHDKNMWKNKGPLEKKPQKEKAWILGRKKKVQMLNPVAKRVYAKPMKEEEEK
jgi:hypothetical protein